MPESFADWVAITNSATVDSESAASTMNIQAGSHIKKIIVNSLTVGNTYAVKIDATGMSSPQRYVIPNNGAPANTNGGKWVRSVGLDVDVQVPSGATSVKISTFADVASATCQVGLEWEVGSGGPVTHGDFTTGAPATAGTEAKVGTIAISGGSKLRRILVANRLQIGTITSVRLDYAGIHTPKKWTFAVGYESTGTEVEYTNQWPEEAKEINITVDSNVSSVDVYATGTVNAQTMAIGLVWT